MQSVSIVSGDDRSFALEEIDDHSFEGFISVRPRVPSTFSHGLPLRLRRIRKAFPSSYNPIERDAYGT